MPESPPVIRCELCGGQRFRVIAVGKDEQVRAFVRLECTECGSYQREYEVSDTEGTIDAT